MNISFRHASGKKNTEELQKRVTWQRDLDFHQKGTKMTIPGGSVVNIASDLEVDLHHVEKITNDTGTLKLATSLPLIFFPGDDIPSFWV